MDTALLALMLLFLALGLLVRRWTKGVGALLILLILGALCYLYLT